MAYTTFQGVKSGLNNTVKGELPIEDIWEAFAYRKELTVQVFIDVDPSSVIPTIKGRDLMGQWKVRLHENGARNAQGKLTAPILFEQTVTWAAHVTIATFPPGISLVTWAPKGDGGSGSQQTSIVDGRDCPIVTNVNDPAQVADLEAYGRLGAWQFVDSATIRPTATPRQKYDAEQGFTLFTDEGAATVGGYNFFATWQSPYYRMDLAEGAVLDTVFDNWQSSILTEARYTVSGRESAQGEAILFDERLGVRTHIYVARGALTPSIQCIRTRQLRPNLTSLQVQFGTGITVNTSKIHDDANGTVEEDSRLRGLQLAKLSGGALLCLGATGGNPALFRAFTSTDGGENWQRVMNQLLNINPLAQCSFSEGKQLIYGTDERKKAVYCILSFGRVTGDDGKETDGFRVTEKDLAATSGSVALPTKTVSLEAGSGGVARLLARDTQSGELRVWVTRDGKNYSPEVTS